MTTPRDPSPDVAVTASLLAGCRRGARDAQARLYALCHRQVYRLMGRMVGWQDAEDLTQQVFLQVFRKVAQFAGQAKFETWLYRVAVNEALQHLRRGDRWKFQTLVSEPVAEQRLEKQRGEQRELLERALARLEPDLRAMFLLREVDGLSYRDIADATQIPEGTVGSRLNRARRDLRQHLADLGWEG